MEINRLPAWLQAYRDGHRQGNAQALAAYADYYCMDGSADMELDIEERLGYIPPPMVSYASRTGTRRNLAAMRGAGWRLGVWGATEQKVHLSPAPARKPLWRLVSSGKPSFCRTIASPFVIGV